ncbi:lipoprotein [Treponema denticola]|uniref:Lipoprotein, putative n=2 Tax=Treponemataceae TaxID=2845253 RepID=Q73NA9_TREDE|nr:lipoprotein, putative [Treponema denticola ATCC 35405]EMB37220.1 polymorphic outer membrane protein [Treponema denticola ATCC 33521]EMB41307.1 polymorphic outer membrane protein [Treponema denticola ATCC 35404]HCY96015.1 lipoprotein [Treponema sp.]
MRKLLTFLTILTAAVAVIVLFTACEQFLKDPEDFLSYWASEAFIKDHSIGAVARPDEAGVPCVSSSPEVHIMLTVHNPKNFPLVMPTSSESAGIVEFKELSQQPTEGTHYVLGQTAPGRLKLTYKEAFLQEYEQGSGSLNPTITLKATDGRVFKKTYTFGIKSNTPPPEPAVVLAKQTNAYPLPSYYVLCIDTKDLVASSAIVNGKYIHDDIAYVTINGTSYNLKMNNAHNGFIEKPATESFLENGTGLMAVGSAQLPTASPWVLYYKTNIKIRDSNPLTTYRITLRDKEGVVSDEAVATIAASGPTHTVTFSVEGGTGMLKAEVNGTEIHSGYDVEKGKTVTFTATPADGWKVKGWTASAGTLSVGGTDTTATLTVTDNATVTVKFKKITTVNGGDGAWKLLKKVVEIADPNSTITIDGRIGATSGNSGEIEIDETLTIEGKTGPDKDILDANGLSRIFKVASGKTLTLKNLTLTGGKATGTGDAGCGGAIFARDASEIKIENCIITGNEAGTNGGGLNVEGTPTTITNCTFTGNTAKNGGGIYIMETSTRRPVVTISGGTIGGTETDKANKATGNGGGIYVGDWCELRLQDSEDPGAQSVLIIGNQAAKGGGVYAKNVLQVSMKNGTRIAVNNDVYLDSGSWIQVAGALSNNPAARITVPNGKYLPSTKVLDGNAALLNSEHGKFAVTPKGDEYWTVGNDGRLTKDKAAIFNNITKDQIEAANSSMIYDENNIITDRTILLGKLVLYKTNQGNYGIMHVTEVDNTTNSGKGHIKFNSKTFNQYGGVLKTKTDKVLEGGECFQFEYGGDPGSKLDFYLQNNTDGTKWFKPLNLARFYILSN